MIRTIRLRALLRSGHSRRGTYISSRSFRSQTSLLCSCTDHAEPLNPTTAQPAIPPADHRALASALDLFSTTAYSPGTPLLHPDGSHVFLKLQQFLRAQYAVFGFREVVSPTIYKQALWEKSGHWQNYKDDMFEVKGSGHGEGQDAQLADEHNYGLKPMNCPGHCLLFKSRKRSWRDLPIRYADFSPLHRNENSGSLSGLTRVRRFHQDDGHIFCTPEQVGEEIQKTLKFVGMVYDCFGLGPYKLVLSTRPDDYIGEIGQWEKAESQLRVALDASGRDWQMNEGDGAFYGPKIDIILKDSDGKEHQTATIQLDFQLPERFDLEYDGEERTARPVMVHRAILGSLERFMALLIEHFKGKWPFWLSPRQVAILPINNQPETLAYAESIRDELNGFVTTKEDLRLQPLNANRLQTVIDERATTLGAKKSQARSENYSLIVVVGDKEVQNGTLALDITGLQNSDVVLKAGLMPVESEIKNKRAITLTAKQLKQLTDQLCHNFI